jgi:hypothetical protein
MMDLLLLVEHHLLLVMRDSRLQPRQDLRHGIRRAHPSSPCRDTAVKALPPRRKVAASCVDVACGAARRSPSGKDSTTEVQERLTTAARRENLATKIPAPAYYQQKVTQGIYPRISPSGLLHQDGPRLSQKSPTMARKNSKPPQCRDVSRHHIPHTTVPSRISHQHQTPMPRNLFTSHLLISIRRQHRAILHYRIRILRLCRAILILPCTLLSRGETAMAHNGATWRRIRLWTRRRPGKREGCEDTLRQYTLTTRHWELALRHRELALAGYRPVSRQARFACGSQSLRRGNLSRWRDLDSMHGFSADFRSQEAP